MRLVFPGGEHAPVALGEGTLDIGSDPACRVVIAAVGIAARHCEIAVAGGSVSVMPLDGAAPTVLNGRQIRARTPLDEGDLLLFGRVGCSLVGNEHKNPMPPAAAAPPPPVADDDGRTRVRASLPKFVLRGLSGPTLGKSFSVLDNTVIGRQPDCAIPIAAAEVSRQHVRLKPNPTGIHVEDLGSANGTFINDKRVQAAQLMPGDELRLDTIRFVLVAPGMDARQQAARLQPPPAAPAGKGARSPALLVIGAVVVLAIVLLGLRAAGVF